MLTSATVCLALTTFLAPADASAPTSPTEKIALFNGRDLIGWTTWLVDAKTKDPRWVYTVKDGLLRISGDGYGHLATEKAYRDYELKLEFRWGKFNRPERKSNARDSGLFLHAVGPDGNSYDGGGAFKAAVECQIMQGAVGDFLLIKGKDHAGKDVPVRLTANVQAQRDADGWPTWDSKGKEVTLERTGRLNWRDKSPGWKDALDFRGPRDADSVGDAWTTLKCTCRGSAIQVFVNGRLVNECRGCYPSSGQILLQCEGSEIFFRRIELHPLPSESIH